MRLLIITQKVDKNDSNLGFFHHWLERFAKNLDKLYVACLSEGEHSLPNNIEVFSLGKEKGYSKVRQFFRLQKFLWKNLGKVDGVFFHMCPIYSILSFPLAKIFRKKTGLWYLHRSLNWKLKLARNLVDVIFTASEQSCRLKNRKKIQVIGHGIDTEMFKRKELGSFSREGAELLVRKEFNSFQLEGVKLLYVGRIAPIKDLETLVQAVDILVNQKHIGGLEVSLVGEPVDNIEKQYSEKIMELIVKKNLQNIIRFKGRALYGEMPQVYQNADILINLCSTGGMDKAVLEAMASGIMVLVSNLSFTEELGPYQGILMFQQGNSQDLAEKICFLKSQIEISAIGSFLRERVVKCHNLDNVIERIIREFQQ